MRGYFCGVNDCDYSGSCECCLGYWEGIVSVGGEGIGNRE